jgi:hypothetical protein
MGGSRMGFGRASKKHGGADRRMGIGASTRRCTEAQAALDEHRESRAMADLRVLATTPLGYAWYVAPWRLQLRGAGTGWGRPNCLGQLACDGQRGGHAARMNPGEETR